MAFLSKTKVAFDEISKKIGSRPFVAFRIIASAAAVKFIYWATTEFSLEPTRVVPANLIKTGRAISTQSQVKEFVDKDQD